jgi:hypothetical protein
LTVVDHGHNLEMRAQQIVNPLSHSRVVVGYQNSRAKFHKGLCDKTVNTKTIENELDALWSRNVTAYRSVCLRPDPIDAILSE